MAAGKQEGICLVKTFGVILHMTLGELRKGHLDLSGTCYESCSTRAQTGRIFYILIVFGIRWKAQKGMNTLNRAEDILRDISVALKELLFWIMSSASLEDHCLEQQIP